MDERRKNKDRSGLKLSQSSEENYKEIKEPLYKKCIFNK